MEREPDQQQKSRENMLAVSLGIFVGGLTLFYLYLITLGIVSNVLAGFVIFFLVGLMHYLGWGRAFSEEVAAERAAMLRQEAQEAARQTHVASDAIQDLSRTQGIR